MISLSKATPLFGETPRMLVAISDVILDPAALEHGPTVSTLVIRKGLVVDDDTIEFLRELLAAV